MTELVPAEGARILIGDVRERLRDLPDGSVDCCVTSPPFWGLRDYGVDGQLGLEPTPDLYVQNMVAVFREIRRVLAAHGTCWLNLGDSYAGGGGFSPTAPTTATSKSGRHGSIGGLKQGGVPVVAGLKPKDLVGIPWRVAFALQADGWWLRSDIIWAKPNPMPESVTDRPTKAHEYVFLLTKGPRYWFDQEAVREPAEWARWGDQTNRKHEGSGSAAGWIGDKSKDELQRRSTPTWDERKAAGATRGNVAFNGNVGAGTQRGVHGEGVSHDLGDPTRGRNVRSVWEIATQPYPEAHFATFPEELARRCVVAGCPVEVCRVCGRPRERIVERVLGREPRITPSFANHHGAGPDGRDGSRAWVESSTTLGWSECGCGESEGQGAWPAREDRTPASRYRPGVVLDPFLGSGTSLVMALRNKRHGIGIELNAEYAELARKRLARWWDTPKRAPAPKQDETLFGL